MYYFTSFFSERLPPVRKFCQKWYKNKLNTCRKTWNKYIKKEFLNNKWIIKKGQCIKVRCDEKKVKLSVENFVIVEVFNYQINKLEFKDTENSLQHNYYITDGYAEGAFFIMLQDKNVNNEPAVLVDIGFNIAYVTLFGYVYL